jgi:hypothetical protein
MVYVVPLAGTSLKTRAKDNKNVEHNQHLFKKKVA